MNVHTKEYLQDTIQFEHNGFKFTFNPSDDNIMLFDTKLGGEKAQAYGNKARWDFLQYIESTKQKYEHNDKIIIDKLKAQYKGFDKKMGLKKTEDFFEKNSELLFQKFTNIPCFNGC